MALLTAMKWFADGFADGFAARAGPSTGKKRNLRERPDLTFFAVTD